MLSLAITTLALASAAAGRALEPRGVEGTFKVTAHDLFESDIGVVGCKVDINSVIYFDEGKDCNNLCFEVTGPKDKLYMLNIGASTGAHDISYDAWNKLLTGKSAMDDPKYGVDLEVTIKKADMSNCEHLLDNGKVPWILKSPNFYSNDCAADSWVKQNSVFYNFDDTKCVRGIDEKCTLDPVALKVIDPAGCPSGEPYSQKDIPEDLRIKDIKTPNGKLVPAQG